MSAKNVNGGHASDCAKVTRTTPFSCTCGQDVGLSGDRMRLANGYEGAFYATPNDGETPTVHLYYATHAEAEAAFEAWCELIDRMLRDETKGD